MAPEWGRPPEGLDTRARRGWERRAQELEFDQHRVEEVDSDDESVSSAAYARYMGYDGPSRTHAVPVRAYAELAYEEDYDAEDDYERNAEWQLAMREKEEELAERALRRIRRARLRGDSNVNLSREELDALERRQSRGEQERRPPARAPPPERQRALSNLSPKQQQRRKSSGGIFGLSGSPKTKPVKKDGRVVSPTNMDEPQHQLPPVSSSSSLQRLSGNSPRTSRRSSRSILQPAIQQPLYELHDQPNYRPPSSRSSRRGISPPRSLPDDPDWIPRSRSSSNAQTYPPLPHQAASGAADPFAYQIQGPTARRIVSDPVSHNVNYASVRRNPPRQAQMAARGRAVEYVELSDDEEEEDDELAGEDEGGVSVQASGDGRAAFRDRVQQSELKARKGRGR